MRRGSTFRPQSPAFGAWLLAEIKAAGLTQGEFADRVGVSRTTVSRWVHGRVPDGVFIDPIADVLVLGYDEVSERAGYRPVLPTDDLDAFHARIDPHLRKVLDDPAALDVIERMVASFVSGQIASRPADPVSVQRPEPAHASAPGSPSSPARLRSER